jgi:heptosyltransferase-2
VSAVDYYLKLVRSTGCSVDASPRLELAVSNADRLAAARLFQRMSIDASRPLVTLNNGGGYGAAKKWPLERLIDLAERLVTGTEAAVLFVCGPAERGDAVRIERAITARRIHTLADVEPSIGLTKACVERSHVLVSTDSGVRHFAAAFDVPCVTLFGPSDPRWSDNYHAGERRLRVELPCSPCGRRACPLKHHRCLRDIAVDQVFRAVAESLTPSVGGSILNQPVVIR